MPNFISEDVIEQAIVQLVACNSQIGSAWLGLTVPGLVFIRPIAMAIGLTPDQHQAPPSLRPATPDLTVTGH